MEENRPRFFCPLQVRYVETDMQGHVFFGHYLTYFDLGITEYLKAIGYGYEEFLSAGVDFFYVESLCQYKDRAFFDEVLHVHTAIDRIGNSSFSFRFQVYEEKSDRLISQGRIVAVAIDRETRKPVRAPEGLRAAVEVFEGANRG
jgi:acyl-CoA thioester hydrolase